ncbi:hypothetical protein LB577_04590 [Mesorhizobium sp. B283B1A]|uniref:hypothetical protein n=1 Tax=Mesorhizobium TaxID=68287 RepID=UPI001CD0F8DD|nr:MULTISPECIES: hypothetical protein [Mesorhizobium]MCA0046233.1 hypothetical protein [Mesorhizobium sp. B283B1A]UQS62845.1 hypothetical protein M5D98_22190 [Mesorhizobium opportunistum]
MNQTDAEVLILTINAMSAGTLVFIARVLQPIMDQMRPPSFKSFLTSLVRNAMMEPILVTVGTLPIIAAVPYFYFFGLSHGWFVAGLVAWFVGSAASKIINQPIYNWVGNPKNIDAAELLQQRVRLARGNNLRALINVISVLMMAAQFGLVEAVITVVAAAVGSIPLVLLGRRYVLGKG